MNVKILLGTVRHNSSEFGTGDIVELPDKEAEALIREGVVESYLADDESKVEPVEEPEVEVEEVEEEIVVEDVPAPSINWTKSELLEAAGLDADTKMKKAEILEVIEKGGDEE